MYTEKMTTQLTLWGYRVADRCRRYMIVSVKQNAVSLFDRMYGFARQSRMLGGPVVIVLAGACLTEAAASTDGAPGLSTAIEELRAANKAWKENDKEFKSLQRAGEASEVEVGEFSEFVDGLKQQVLDGCREVRALGGDPDRQVAECKRLEKASRQASKTAEKRNERGPLSGWIR